MDEINGKRFNMFANQIKQYKNTGLSPQKTSGAAAWSTITPLDNARIEINFKIANMARPTGTYGMNPSK